MAHSKTSSESLPSTASPIENPPVVANEQAAPSNEAVLNEKDVEAAAPRAPPPNFLGQVPNGGLQAWLQVIAGFSLFFNTWVCRIGYLFVASTLTPHFREFSTLLAYPALGTQISLTNQASSSSESFKLTTSPVC